VLRESTPQGTLVVLSKPEAVAWAQGGRLWCQIPGGGGRRVKVEAFDSDGDGRDDYVRTVGDGTRRNNLLALPIWSRRQNRWISQAA
jgi:hypothetical protein